MPSLPPIRPRTRPARQAGKGAFDAPRSEAGTTGAGRLSAAPRRRFADPRPAAGRMVRACAGARGRPQPRQPRARPDRAGDASARRRRAMPTSSLSTATCSISAIACWSSSPMAISRGPSRGICCSRPGSTCCSSGLPQSSDRFLANSRPRRSRKSPITASWRRNGRSGWATAPRKARGAWPKGSTGAGASCRSCSRSTSCWRS